jgi:hypothetical protein
LNFEGVVSNRVEFQEDFVNLLKKNFFLVNSLSTIFFLISVNLEWTLKVQKSTLIGRPKNPDANDHQLRHMLTLIIYLVDPKNCSTYIINRR